MLPYIKETKKTRSFVDSFRGYNKRERIAENELSDAYNVTNDSYPVLATRAPRGVENSILKGIEVIEILGFCGGEAPCVLAAIKKDGGEAVRLIYGGAEYDVGLSDSYRDKCELIKMGAHVVLFPARIAFNTLDGSFKSFATVFYQSREDLGDGLYNCKPLTLRQFVGRRNDLGAVWYEEIQIGVNYEWRMPDGGKNEGDNLLSDELVLWRIDGEIELATTYVEKGIVYTFIECPEAKALAYASIKEAGAWIYTFSGKAIEGEDFPDKDKNFIKFSNRDYRDTAAMTRHIRYAFIDGKHGVLLNTAMIGIDSACVGEGENTRLRAKVKFTRADEWYDPAPPYDPNIPELEGIFTQGYLYFSYETPRLDFVVEAQNRLWGARYGTDVSGKTVNEIYATSLGSYDDWYSAMDGSAADAWAASVGVGGEFTGALTLGNTPIFFKENVAFKIYPSSSGAHQVVKIDCVGVARECSGSVALLGNVAYYKGRDGIYAFDGVSESKISEALGIFEHVCPRAGAYGDKYVAYCEMGGEGALYVYDRRLGLWQRELTDAPVSFMATCGGSLYIAESARIYSHRANAALGESEERSVPYMLKTGGIGYSSPDSKYVSRIDLRTSLRMGASLNVYVEYDGDGQEVLVSSVKGITENLKTITVHVVPRRCEFFKIRLTGRGEMKLYSISRVYEETEI